MWDQIRIIISESSFTLTPLQNKSNHNINPNCTTHSLSRRQIKSHSETLNDTSKHSFGCKLRPQQWYCRCTFTTPKGIPPRRVYPALGTTTVQATCCGCRNVLCMSRTALSQFAATDLKFRLASLGRYADVSRKGFRGNFASRFAKNENYFGLKNVVAVESMVVLECRIGFLLGILSLDVGFFELWRKWDVVFVCCWILFVFW